MASFGSITRNRKVNTFKKMTIATSIQLPNTLLASCQGETLSHIQRLTETASHIETLRAKCDPNHIALARRAILKITTYATPENLDFLQEPDGYLVQAQLRRLTSSTQFSYWNEKLKNAQARSYYLNQSSSWYLHAYAVYRPLAILGAKLPRATGMDKAMKVARYEREITCDLMARTSLELVRIAKLMSMIDKRDIIDTELNRIRPKIIEKREPLRNDRFSSLYKSVPGRI